MNISVEQENIQKETITHLELLQLRDSIEKLSSNHHIDILKIIKKHNISYSENLNGIFINLTELDNDTFNSLKTHLEYLKEQQEELEYIETQKKDYEDKYFYKQS
jgi:hypothetical protein